MGILAEYHHVVTGMLQDAKDQVRWEAVTILGKLQHSDLEKVADTLSEQVLKEEPKESVREAAIKVLLKLDPLDLAKHAAQIVEVLNDESNFVRLWALIALDRLTTEEKNKYEPALVKKLDDDYLPIREKAGQILNAHRIENGTALGDD